MRTATGPTLIRRRLRDPGDSHREPRHERENAICEGCGAVLKAGRWVYDHKRRQTLKATGKARQALCLGCERATQAHAQGILGLHGPFMASRQDEILGLVWKRAKDENRQDPTQRIIDVYPNSGGVVVWTTTPKLAQKLGRAINKAYKGELTQVFSRGDHLVRVDWTR